MQHITEMQPFATSLYMHRCSMTSGTTISYSVYIQEWLNTSYRSVVYIFGLSLQNVFIARYMLDHSIDLPIERDFPSGQWWCILVLRLALSVIACRTTAYQRFIANPISCSIITMMILTAQTSSQSFVATCRAMLQLPGVDILDDNQQLCSMQSYQSLQSYMTVQADMANLSPICELLLNQICIQLLACKLAAHEPYMDQSVYLSNWLQLSLSTHAQAPTISVWHLTLSDSSRRCSQV